MYYFQFGLYFFSFLLTESVINDRAVDIVGVDYVNLIYAIGLFCTAFGYYLFSFIYQRTKKEFVISMCVATTIAALFTAFIFNPVVYLISAYVCLISFGYLGSYAHYQISLYNNKPHFTFNIGTVMALAIILQFLIQLFKGNQIIFVISISVSAFLFAVMKKREERDTDLKTSDTTLITGHQKVILFSRNMIVCIMMVAIMSMILGIEDSIMVYKNAAGELALFSGIRLFYAFGLFVAGAIAEIKDRIFLPLSTVCAVMLSTVVITFLSGDSLSYNLSMGFMYFYSGFYVIYLTLIFVDMASRMRNGRLIAGVGRIVRSITTAVIVILISVLGNSLNYTICNVVNCILSIFIIGLFAVSEMLKSKADNEIDYNCHEIKEINNQERYEEFCNYYHFTEKEKESFVLLISTEDTVQKIADDMGISRRVLQRHISSMYEKTETQTRVGLLMAYAKYLEG